MIVVDEEDHIGLVRLLRFLGEVVSGEHRVPAVLLVLLRPKAADGGDVRGIEHSPLPNPPIRTCLAQISNSTPISMICPPGILKYAPGRWAL